MWNNPFPFHYFLNQVAMVVLQCAKQKQDFIYIIIAKIRRRVEGGGGRRLSVGAVNPVFLFICFNCKKIKLFFFYSFLFRLQCVNHNGNELILGFFFLQPNQVNLMSELCHLEWSQKKKFVIYSFCQTTMFC